ncbi:hypothetical protein PFICI_15023 [Pestalotiopsis fici W106-1]|uniref:Phytocyanin domain-containing protein n=1 Tax=Pestalotiopsis fici (strain W106-1 / CGMCC3.15140) TaxID=1229662 RepID=W3WHP7_PESFW|nr:uncharacterized protein PFICI_15023 [Pestalotiopsis fici W106-1]ETS73418.1 hypothetical protein PFICI_15023 [Pestalotiopsis fici W106-1]
MKLSAVLALAIAAPALAKSVHNVYPVAKREDDKSNKDNSKDSKNNKNNNNNNNNNNAVPIIVQAATTEIIILWNNPGNGAATTTINNAVTVTQTVTAGAAQTTVGTATVAAGATSVVAGAGATHTVVVGGSAGLVFTPAEVKAAIGDSVVFTFESNNHTVTQSAFATPCDPLAGGMDSGFVPNVNNTVTPPPQVAMQVMVDTPLWFYCRQQGHCGKGMAMSINPTADKTQAMFQAMAIAQKGAGAGSAITGNGTAAAPAAGSSAAAASSAAATTAAGAAATGSVQSGLGTLTPGTGQCVCAVSCGTGAFPAVQAQGVGAFGGFAGALPASMAEA